MHQSYYYVEMLRALGFRFSGTAVQLTPTEQQKLSAEKLLGQFGIAGRHPIVGMAPGAAYGPAKRWLPERFASVADRLAVRFSCPVVLFGSAGDRASNEAVQSAAKSTLIDIAGKTNLGDAIALIARCDLFVTNDSGSYARGGGLGVPTVAIFGSTNPDDLPPGERTSSSADPWTVVPASRRTAPPISNAWISSRSTRCYDDSIRLLAMAGYH